MSLSSIKNVKSIKQRKDILQSYLRIHDVGELSDEDDQVMKWLFETYYVPVSGQVKYPILDIDRFFIGIAEFSTKCFRIRLYSGIEDNVSARYLCGEKRSDKEPLTSALRYTIRPQIEEFKRKNPLDPTSVCPIEHISLGNDAEVDHHNPTFKQLVDEWLQENKDPKVNWGPRGSSIYLLEEPFQTSWVNFHQEKANLRWLSKEGNKKAHRI